MSEETIAVINREMTEHMSINAIAINLSITSMIYQPMPEVNNGMEPIEIINDEEDTEMKNIGQDPIRMINDEEGTEKENIEENETGSKEQNNIIMNDHNEEIENHIDVDCERDFKLCGSDEEFNGVEETEQDNIIEKKSNEQDNITENDTTEHGNISEQQDNTKIKDPTVIENDMDVEYDSENFKLRLDDDESDCGHEECKIFSNSIVKYIDLEQHECTTEKDNSTEQDNITEVINIEEDNIKEKEATRLDYDEDINYRFEYLKLMMEVEEIDIKEDHFEITPIPVVTDGECTKDETLTYENQTSTLVLPKTMNKSSSSNDSENFTSDFDDAYQTHTREDNYVTQPFPFVTGRCYIDNAEETGNYDNHLLRERSPITTGTETIQTYSKDGNISFTCTLFNQTVGQTTKLVPQKTKCPPKRTKSITRRSKSKRKPMKKKKSSNSR